MREVSDVRSEVFQSMEGYAQYLLLRGKKILEVGTAGDPVAKEIGKPAGNYIYFGNGNEYKTLDILPEVKPDYLGDICNSGIPSDSFDLVICSQTLEHIFDYRKAVAEIFRITREWAIIDTPFMVPYHGEKGFDDYWRFTKPCMEKILEEAGFREIQVQASNNLITALCRK